MLVTIKAGIISPEVSQLRYWIRGTKGSFKKHHLDVQEDQLRKEKLSLSDPSFGHEPSSYHGTIVTFASEKAEPVVRTYPTVTPPPTYVEYYRVFAKALRGEGSVPVGAEEARDVLVLIEAAQRSSDEGRTVEV